MNKSLLIMPDISGFTAFVKETEISHSQHIISELLEILIDANELDLVLSEVEGDAILFYTHNKVPEIEALLNQAKKMYINFHAHLKRYDLQRVCQCGACSTASKLQLKIIAHSGEFGFISVKEKRKPHGSDVVLVHRLLKNSIPAKEYLLLSGFDNLPMSLNETESGVFLDGSTSYDSFGEIKYKYMHLSRFSKDIPDLEPLIFSEKIKDPLVYEGFIKCDSQNLFEIISNLDKRLSWNKGVDKLIYEKDRVNRVGTRHTCLINGKNLEFETVSNDYGANKLVYGERASVPIVKEFSVYYILESKPGGTQVRIEVHYIPIPLIGWLLVPLFRRKFATNIDEIFKGIKAVCEASAGD